MTQMQPPGPAYQPPAAAAKGGGLAVAALVLGLCALIPFIGGVLGLTAIVLGIVALVQKTARKRMATVGIVVGAVGMLVTPAIVILAIAMPPLGRSRELAKQAICGANLNTIGKGLHIYLAEYDQMPPDIWIIVEEGTSAQCFKCPSATGNRRSDYFFHLPQEPAAGTTIIACDYRGNHKDGRNILTYQATVKWLSEADFQAELAKPDNAAFAKALRQAEGP